MRGLPQKQNARRADKIRLCGHLGRYKKIVKKTYIIYLNIFNRYERNIHVIMSYIRGFHMDFMQLDKPSICILKILLILGTPLDIVTLKTIYIRNAHLPTNIIEADFNVLINKMSIQGFIARDQRDCIHLNNNIVT